ncbi:MAG: RdgB/HAM1 family non-canonical purine NTP pyrophosphatase [Planctomycetes bacterium]|nr:RdgB/HAM1 family non-canonical purine NTP pyrophosphatase [Planctomycetota bacterium]
MRLLIATGNKGKLREFKSLFAQINADLVGLDEAGIKNIAPENGKTFFENAASKCVFYSSLVTYPVFAEDSGICVEFLKGAPGVRSARFAGANAASQDNNELLLKKLEGIPFEKRKTYYIAVCIFGYKGKIFAVSSDRCYGYINSKSEGTNGFGYDPIFYVKELGKTTAQLSPEEKNKISHRGKAVKKLLPTISPHF